jgi:hypothetical protein
MRRLLIAAALGMALASLAACATQTPYQPSAGANSYGFSEQVVEANRLRITFRGNTLTDRETVETYLLYRAAEMTLERGFDYFVVIDRNTESRSRVQPVGGSSYGMFPYDYRYYSPRWGWRPFYDPFWDDPVTYREVTRYEATAEITMHRGHKPANQPTAYSAREVQTNLAGRIVHPPPPATR